MGSKSKIVKYLAPIIQSKIDENHITTYWEPFVGGANVIDHISCKHRYGSDINYYLIELLKKAASEPSLLDNLPNTLTREHYNEVRNDYNNNLQIYQPWYIGAIGFLGSYCGRYFDGGFAPSGSHFDGSKMVVRDYYNESLNNLKKQAKQLQDIEFRYGDYLSAFQFIQNSMIYCDPPYINTKQYSMMKSFNHEEFWNWCRCISKKNIVLISEQEAPDDFECIWQYEIGRTIKATDKSRTVEKLFRYKG